MKINSIKDDDFIILNMLSDGSCISEEYIASIFGNISISDVNEKIKILSEKYGVDISLAQSMGYKWKGATALLSEEKIRQGIKPKTVSQIESIDIYGSVGSTNSTVREGIYSIGQKARIVVSEHQTSGRGRGNRKWVSPLGQNIYFSMAYKFGSLPENLSAFSLVVGIAVVRTLNSAGVDDAKLKWPNDIWVNQKKISGILIESIYSDIDKLPILIIGIGINYDMSKDMGKDIDIEWTDVASNSLAENLNRNLIVADLINNLLNVCEIFEKSSFDGFLDEYESLDITKGRKVFLSSKVDGVFIDAGISQGVSSNGGLIVIKNGKSTVHVGGEISLKFGD